MRVPDVTLTGAELASLRTRPLAIPVSDALFRIEGPGTFSCLQGLLTNDVLKLEHGQAIWGAFLTPKGMIVSDAWVARDGDAAWVIVPAAGHDQMKLLFGRTMPPRLAKVADQSATLRVWWLVGETATAPAGASMLRPAARAPFDALLIAPQSATIETELVAQGRMIAPAAFAEAARLLHGWPTVGREIDERTLPQEVRFDELGGVKYDKGCYTGQETVARLHFRGHANRALRAVEWSAPATDEGGELSVDGKTVGTLRTVALLGERLVALAILRREIVTGDTVVNGADELRVIDFPIDDAPAAVA
jgi:folate-binding protein YgfZ